MRIVIVVALCAGPAAADPLTLWAVPERGELAVRLSVESELSRHHRFAPVSAAPDAAYGITDGLAVAVHYSRASHAALGAGNGVCIEPPRETLEMAPAACPETETGLGAGVLAQLGDHVVGRAGLAMHGPRAAGGELGVTATGRAGRWWVVGAPTVIVGITGRSRGDRDRLQTAVYAGANAGRGELHLRSGVEGALATFHDTYAVPLGAGASLPIGGLRVGVDAALDRAFGALNSHYWRSASVYVETTLGGRR